MTKFILAPWEMKDRHGNPLSTEQLRDLKFLCGSKFVSFLNHRDDTIMRVFPLDIAHIQIVRKHRLLDEYILGSGFIAREKDDQGVLTGLPCCHGASDSIVEFGYKPKPARPEDTVLLQEWFKYSKTEQT